MLKRILLFAVASVLLVAPPARGQTIFRATGGDVTITPVSFQSGVVFSLFLESVGNQPRRLIMSDDGTSITLGDRGTVANSGFGSLGSYTLGSFAAGTGLAFDFVLGGVTYSNAAFYTAAVGGYNAQYVSGTGQFIGGESSLIFRLSGVRSLENFHCTLPNRFPIVCPADIPAGGTVTATPEPGTIALFATGLASLIPVVIRRRRRA